MHMYIRIYISVYYIYIYTEYPILDMTCLIYIYIYIYIYVIICIYKGLQAFGTSFSFCHKVSHAVHDIGAACPIFLQNPLLPCCFIGFLSVLPSASC